MQKIPTIAALAVLAAAILAALAAYVGADRDQWKKIGATALIIFACALAFAAPILLAYYATR